MATYYVGSGGNNGNTGLSWAQRKLTLNGAEDIPVAAGDTVYVAPGVYRELLTVDVSGTNGNPITYIGDITGEHTDGVGGVVRVTGSDNDQTTARANCITATSKDYRTFRGFTFDTCSSHDITLITACGNWIIEDCHFGAKAANANHVNLAGTGTTNTIRRCWFSPTQGSHVYFTHSSVVDNAGHLVENCVGAGAIGNMVRVERVGGVTVKNCLAYAENLARVFTALNTGQTLVVRNCIVAGGGGPILQATTSAEFDEDYNALHSGGTLRTNVNVGANSVTYPPLLNPFLLLSGFKLPQFGFPSLSEWSAVKAIAGNSEASDDLFGLTRPATSSKKSWGPVQWVDAKRETSTVHAGSASLKIADAGLQFVRRVPVTNTSTTIALFVRWETDYSGTKPRMVIKQPGQSNRTTTATGSAGAWEQLSDTFTPAALPPYVDIYVELSNTATSGNYATFVDDLTVA